MTFLYVLYIMFITLVVSANGRPSCMCIEATQCYPYIFSMSNIFQGEEQAVLQFWRDKFCGYDFRIPKVCCDISVPQGPFDSQNAPAVVFETTTRKEDNSEGKNSGTGATEAEHVGDCICISLPDCEPYTTLARHSGSPLKPSLVKFLRSQQCGFENDFPKVCCPPKSEPVDLTGSEKIGTSTGNSNIMPTQEPIKVTPDHKLVTTHEPLNLKPPIRNDWTLPEKSDIINQQLSNFDMFALLRRSLGPTNNPQMPTTMK